MTAFLQSELSDDITQVPGIGYAAAEKLKLAVLYKDGSLGEPGVFNTFQLVGKYLSFRQRNITQQQHNDAFMEWLQLKGVNAHRVGITQALAEYLSVIIPSPYPEKTS